MSYIFSPLLEKKLPRILLPEGRVLFVLNTGEVPAAPGALLGATDTQEIEVTHT